MTQKLPLRGGFCVSLTLMRAAISPAAIFPSIAARLISATMGKSHLMNTCRLRKFRKSAHLTQREVAMLVGYASQRAYSDLELGLKRPALGTALGCCILFNASLNELFPDLAEFVRRDVLARARKLSADLAQHLNREAAASNMDAVVVRIAGSSTSE